VRACVREGPSGLLGPTDLGTCARTPPTESRHDDAAVSEMRWDMTCPWMFQCESLQRDYSSYRVERVFDSPSTRQFLDAARLAHETPFRCRSEDRDDG